MPTVPYQLAQRATPNSTTTEAAYPTYPAAILLAFFSFILMLLILPPLVWHFRNRNIGATALVAWTVTLLLFNVINAIIWPNDNISTWYDGVGLCDIEVKIQFASEVGRPASFACISRALAAILDTDRATLIKTKAQRRRNYIIDLSWCLGFPLLQMVFHYIVQWSRYYVYGISGCVQAVGRNWLAVVLLAVPPFIFIMINLYYSVLILVRLCRYRLTFSSILANNDTSKSRFMRLYMICIAWIVCYIPVECYVLFLNFNKDNLSAPYSWSTTHDPQRWKEIVMVPSGGTFIFARWIWLSCGVAVFAFFGFGRDAVNMYRTCLLAIGMGRIFPSLRHDYRGSITATISSYGSKARTFFNRKSYASSSTSKSASNASQTSSADRISPTKEIYVASAGQLPDSAEKRTSPFMSTKKARLPYENDTQLSTPTRILSKLQYKKATRSKNLDQLPLTDMSRQPSTVLSAITSGPRSPTLWEDTRSVSSNEMMIRTEIRQNSG